MKLAHQGALLIVLIVLVGCTATVWKDTGLPGPWCSPDTRAHILYRTVNSIGMSNPQGEMALAEKLGVKKSEFVLHDELDKYFSKCTFINQWPTHGTINSIPAHESPFDLCMVSINPMVIVGVKRQNPEVSSLGPMDTWGSAFIGSSYLLDEVAIRTQLPYYPSANIVWFSPDIDYDLHQVDVSSGTASFAIGKNEKIVAVVEGGHLTILRK